MASLRSLGTVKPSALQYLAAEGILPDDPEPDAYRWKTTYRVNSVYDEILIAQSWVVWSRCGTIKRVLNLASEKEDILQAFTTTFDLQHDEHGKDSLEEALVVVLNTQVHILLLSGDSHILPLSFEPQKALACPGGFVLQRRAAKDIDDSLDLTQHDLSTINESQTTLRPGSGRPSLLLTDFDRAFSRSSDNVPRTFSCVDPMSELGLVVCGDTDKARSLNDCHALPFSETLVYLSPYDELEDLSTEHEHLCLAVTADLSNSTVTIWHVARHVPASARTRSKKQTTARKSTSARKSSANLAKSQQTRESHLRQSFGAQAQSYADNLRSSASEQKSGNSLADQLGPEFEQTGVQTRSSRRVSSMLARTDLGIGGDRNAFNELATGQASRKSLGRAGARGESIGSFGDRQSFGIRRKSSFHAATSILSTGTSFLNVAGIAHTDHLYNGTNFDQQEIDVSESSDLPRDVGFFKLTTFEWHEPTQGLADLDVFTLLSPGQIGIDQPTLSVCLLDHSSRTIAIVSVQVDSPSPRASLTRSKRAKLKASSIRRGNGISTACIVKDTNTRRLLVVQKALSGEYFMQLEAPWSPSLTLPMPSRLSLTNAQPSAFDQGFSKRGDESKLHATTAAATIDIVRAEGCGGQGQIVLFDSSSRLHQLQVTLAPKNNFVGHVLSMCNFLFGKQFRDSMLVAYWEMRRWIDLRHIEGADEWTALVTTIFTLVVPFLDTSFKSTPAKKKTATLLRSSSGSAVDLTNFKAMSDAHIISQPEALSNQWHWLGNEATMTLPVSPTSPSSRHLRGASLQSALDGVQGSTRTFVTDCVTLAREFIQSPAGEAMIGSEGYLPVAINKDRVVRQTAVAKMTVGLQLLYEEEKLVRISIDRFVTSSLPAVLAQLGTWLRWSAWTMEQQTYFGLQLDNPTQWSIEASHITALQVPSQPFEPPSILQYVCDNIGSQSGIVFPTLATLAEQQSPDRQTEHESRSARLTPLTHAITCVLRKRPWATGGAVSPPQGWDIPTKELQAMPEAIVAVFHQAAAASRASNKHSPSREQPQDAEKARSRPAPLALASATASHHASKDFHSAGVSAFDGETTQRWDLASEADRHAVSRALFQADRRFQEASRLVNQTRPPVVDCPIEPDWTEADLLETQKELAQLVARRTLSIASGRAMMHYSAREPLLTERVPIPAFSLQCLIVSSGRSETAQPMTFSADKSSFTEEKVCWAFFHNGASAGLMVSRFARCVDTSWILYNKPQELTNRHAGFLLALGLNGHLRSLAKWVAFKYLTPKHTMTSIGLLLGLSASYIGTQDQLITRLLSVHVTRLLPVGAAELNLSPLTQTTGIMGIGLLYLSSHHRRMSEVMLSELENSDAEEGVAPELVLRDEGYRLAAGFSLGLINLGQGNELHGLHDMSVPERLLAIAISMKNVNLVHVLDRATSGAVMAIAFIFMKTNNASVASKIDIPDTLHQFDYVRPDIFLLRTLARHLIMWDSIMPTQSFVTRSLPKPYRHRASLDKTLSLATEDLPFFNILAGICFALGLRYAGTQREDARNLLVSYLDHFLRLSRLPCAHYDARVTLNSVRHCLDVVALSAAMVMAGSGDLIVLRRLRSLHGRTDRDTPFGSHMAAHMALGALFLGGGTMTFGTSKKAVASLCISFYPLFPSDVLDNKAHLQALRHLWVLAAESRCLVCKERETGALVGGVAATVYLKNGETVNMKVPGLLPELDTVNSIVVEGHGWWSSTLNMKESKKRNNIDQQGVVTVFMKRKSAFDSAPQGDSIAEELRLLDEHSMRAAGGVPSCNPDLAERTHTSSKASEGDPFEWLFGLESFEDYDAKERDLVLGPYDGDGRRFLEGTPLDARLVVERGLLPDDRRSGEHKLEIDKLYQIRALLQWFDQFDSEDEQMDAQGDDANETRWRSGLWLRREVIDRLRERVFKLMAE
ncbi:Negative regulator of mitosis [Cyphellophora attinorum]|uniref:Negative regulator of mitosis n=1 Tax=Cyphellophora attinorum TaxID=1664694 RepID=A0A0N1HBC1_9EURO|nr:Negative regulator of mitosis [Phialophora attinorum]KPI40490.1 Negative regulator of mitosis [Phialophora attinorum]